MSVQTRAHLDHLPGETPPYLATVAETTGSTMQLYVAATRKQAPDWITPPGCRADVMTHRLPQAARMLYGPGHRRIGGMAACIVGQYLEELQVPHAVNTREAVFAGWSTLTVTLEKPLEIPFDRGPHNSATTQINGVDLAGSALYAVVHTLANVGPDAIRQLQCCPSLPHPLPLAV